MLRVLMLVMCVDTALYAINIDYYHCFFPLRALHSLAHQMRPERFLVDRPASVLGIYFFALSQGLFKHRSNQCMSPF